MANAIKFSDSDAKVIIKVSSNEESNLCISVRDFGVGIEEENMDKIYDRFRQLDTGTRKEFGGHGLGLSIVHSLVDILDGTMEMESKSGEGAFFEIKIPLISLTIFWTWTMKFCLIMMRKVRYFDR